MILNSGRPLLAGMCGRPDSPSQRRAIWDLRVRLQCGAAPIHTHSEEVGAARRRQRLPPSNQLDLVTAVFASERGEPYAPAGCFLQARSPKAAAQPDHVACRLPVCS